MLTVNAGLGLAASAAAIAIAAAAAPAPAAAQAGANAPVVHCYGINTCKGTSDCRTAHSDCKGQNECKGHGFKALTAEACKSAGGSLTEAK
jgi:uncharacterized membrane protein